MKLPSVNSDRAPQQPAARQQTLAFPGSGASSGTSATVLIAHGWEDLQASFVAEFSQPPSDVFAIDQVVVPGAGLRRMLPQVLAAHGMVAGIEFSSPRSFWRQLDADLLGIDQATDPWSMDQLTITVMEALDQVRDQPWASALHHHLSGPRSPRPVRRYATADRVARLFTRYARRLPEMVLEWDRGHMVGPSGDPLDPSQLWQAHLWAMTVAMIGDDHPARRHQRLLEAIADAPSSPVRLGVVVTTAVSEPERQILAGLGRTRPVTIWQLLVAPSPPDAGSPNGVLSGFAQTQRGSADAWQDAGFQVSFLPPVRSQAEPAGMSLLHRVQQRVAGVDLAEPVQSPDGSITLHSSHGLDRQVEVLREWLCTLFADDPTLQPREVVVICPDPRAVGALIQADLGATTGAGSHPGHQLRVQVSGDALAWPNPALRLLLDLLRLPWSRASAQDLVDLCSSSVVRARFDFDEDDLVVLRRMIHQADLRWGLDTPHRDRWGLSGVPQGTWAAGVDRILISTALDVDPPTWMGIATPIGAIESSEVELAGTLAEVVSRIRKTTLGFEAAPVAVWGQRLNEALDLLAAPPRDAAWTMQPVRATLAEMTSSTSQTALSAAEVAALLETRPLPSSRPGFGNGGLQVCGLADLDGFAHRVVIVLGLDDERFPPRSAHSGDDLTQALPVDPQSDPRCVARQRLLTALMSAREHFAVIYQGRDERTNETREPTVPILALRSAIEACAGPGANDPGRGVSYEHPLQPHSTTNFLATHDRGPLSFDHLAFAGLMAQQAYREHPLPAPPPWTQRLGTQPRELADASQERQLNEDRGPGSAATYADLGEVVTFFKHPARELMKRSTGVSMHEWRDDLPDSLPVELGGLDSYHAGNRLLADLLAGVDPTDALRAERLRGATPPGALGSAQLERTMTQVTRLATTIQSRRAQGASHHVELELEIPAGSSPVRLSGDVLAYGTSLIDHEFAWANGSHFVTLWLRLLAVAASRPAERWTGHLVRRRGVNALTAPPADEALDALAQWMALWRQGQEQVVLLPPKSMAAFAGLVIPYRGEQDPPLKRAAQEWRRERDEDWAMLAPHQFADLLSAALPDGRIVEPVAKELWAQITLANGGGQS